MNTVIQLRDQYRSGERQPAAVLVDPEELALLRESARLAAELLTEIYRHRQKGWHKVPMDKVTPLTAAQAALVALLKGRA
jgi:hypothetical protein